MAFVRYDNTYTIYVYLLIFILQRTSKNDKLVQESFGYIPRSYYQLPVCRFLPLHIHTSCSMVDPPHFPLHLSRLQSILRIAVVRFFEHLMYTGQALYISILNILK